MTERQRRTPRPNRTDAGGDPTGEERTHEELDGALDAAERTLEAVSHRTAEAQAKDVVPPGTFHGTERKD